MQPFLGSSITFVSVIDEISPVSNLGEFCLVLFLCGKLDKISSVLQTFYTASRC